MSLYSTKFHAVISRAEVSQDDTKSPGRFPFHLSVYAVTIGLQKLKTWASCRFLLPFIPETCENMELPFSRLFLVYNIKQTRKHQIGKGNRH